MYVNGIDCRTRSVGYENRLNSIRNAESCKLTSIGLMKEALMLIGPAVNTKLVRVAVNSTDSNVAIVGFETFAAPINWYCVPSIIADTNQPLMCL